MQAASTWCCVNRGLQYFPDRMAAMREMARVLAPGGRVGLPRFRGELRAWDQTSYWGVILSSSCVTFFGSTAGGAILPSLTRTMMRPSRAAAVKDGPILGPPEGRVLDGREHGGRVVCVGIDLQVLMPALIVDR